MLRWGREVTYYNRLHLRTLVSNVFLFIILLGLCICPNTFAGVVHYGVFNRQNIIKKGVRFGPFKGKVVNTSEIKSFDDNTYMWEVCTMIIKIWNVHVHYANKGWAHFVENLTNINKTNNRLSLQPNYCTQTEQNICQWESMSWLWTG